MTPPERDRTPGPDDQPSFAEPWHAEVFALAVALHDRGVFTWADWAATLGRHLAGSAGDDTGERYYEHWLAALEELVCTTGATTAEELAGRYDAWDRAARATPHGRPIVLPRR